MQDPDKAHVTGAEDRFHTTTAPGPAWPRGIGPSDEQVIDTFNYHQPNADQIERIARNRGAYKAAARTVLDTCPPGADRTAALRQLHESMMTANKAIACEPKGG